MVRPTDEVVSMVAAAAGGTTSLGDFALAHEAVAWIEGAAVGVIALAVVLALGVGVVTGVRHGGVRAFSAFKRLIARGLLVGLDLLIAADVIKTVTLEPTLENALVLAVLVAIRTFLSWSLVLEIEGRWPWQDRAPRSD